MSFGLSIKTDLLSPTWNTTQLHIESRDTCALEAINNIGNLDSQVPVI